MAITITREVKHVANRWESAVLGSTAKIRAKVKIEAMQPRTAGGEHGVPST
eukprot:CAMPEP_0172782694 /NCGR_PEP_ID=MMETSP1074-20121228/204059_1 /TAXON_ID=2916 /ORGANISM="Ceratium fusus, Strain PA161109" /LENGTH=50 /DNA_ID=CAMNT_0013619677 /DNA_START=580 /DNA_END=732 /DNA_ORIENTATION=-